MFSLHLTLWVFSSGKELRSEYFQCLDKFGQVSTGYLHLKIITYIVWEKSMPYVLFENQRVFHPSSTMFSYDVDIG